MFADDLKVYNESCNHLVMTNDILAVLKWSEQWGLPLNRDQCTILHIDSKNCRHTCCLGDTELKKSGSFLDLGILVTSNLS